MIQLVQFSDDMLIDYYRSTVGPTRALCTAYGTTFFVRRSWEEEKSQSSRSLSVRTYRTHVAKTIPIHATESSLPVSCDFSLCVVDAVESRDV